MTQGMDLGIDKRANYDERGVPYPPTWWIDQVDGGILNVTEFDEDYDIAVQSVPEGARVFLAKRSGEVGDAVMFLLANIALETFAQSMRALVGHTVVLASSPLPTSLGPDLFVGRDFGDFQTFHSIRTDGGAVVYMRAVDTRHGLRLILKDTEAIARFAFSLAAAREGMKKPHMERLREPYTTISAMHDEVKTLEQLSASTKVAKSASGRSVGILPISGAAFVDMIPNEILAKYDENGMLIPRDEPVAIVAPSAFSKATIPWMIVAMLATAILAFVAAKMLH